MRSPGSRACSFSACLGSATTWDRYRTRTFVRSRVAFPFCPQGRRPNPRVERAIGRHSDQWLGSDTVFGCLRNRQTRGLSPPSPIEHRRPDSVHSLHFLKWSGEGTAGDSLRVFPESGGPSVAILINGSE